MNDSDPALDEWRRLYELAAAVKALAPWQWLAETDLFGVQSPETGEPGFVSVMGALGEHCAVALYPGAAGLAGFVQMQQAREGVTPELLLQTPQLQASFEDRGQLAERDRATIKALRLKFRGRQAWPLFRSFRPGFLPWHLEAEEARLLAAALEQLLDVAPRARDDPALLGGPHDPRMLMRVPRERDGMRVWEDERREPPALEEPEIRVFVQTALLAHLKQAGRRGGRVEVDLILSQHAVQDRRGARPQLPYLLLAVSAPDGFILGADMLTVETTLEELWGRVPQQLLEMLARIGARPQGFQVRSQMMYRLLAPLAGELGCRLELARRLPHLDVAQAELSRFL